MTVLLEGVQEWYCPNCKRTVQKRMRPSTTPHVEMHHCPKLRIIAPMVAKGTKAKVTRHEREDYVNGEIVRTDDDGRPVMSITTEREEGQDVVVFAPTATGSGRSL